MKANLRIILTSLLRDKIFIGLLALNIIASLASFFLGSAAIVESSEMATVFSSACARGISAIGSMIFVGIYVQRLYESKEIEAALSRPLSLSKLIFSYWLSFSILSVILNLPVIVLIYSISPLKNYAFALWAFSLLLENLIIVAASLFFSLSLEKFGNSFFISLGFYILSRMAFFFDQIASRQLEESSDSLAYFYKIIIKIIGTILPRLDLFAQSKWLSTPDIEPSGLGIFITQFIIYVPFILCAAIYDLRRKRL